MKEGYPFSPGIVGGLTVIFLFAFVVQDLTQFAAQAAPIPNYPLICESYNDITAGVRVFFIFYLFDLLFIFYLFFLTSHEERENEIHFPFAQQKGRRKV